MATSKQHSLPPAVRQGLEGLLAFLSEPAQPLPEDLEQSRHIVRSWLQSTTRPTQAFPLGSVYCTPGVLAVVPEIELMLALERHLLGDWGDVDAHDWLENDRSVAHGYRLLSAYQSLPSTRFWIITEADRSSTTLLLPDEY